MIHAGEHLHVGFRIKFEKVFHLRFGNKRLFCAIPEVDIGPIDGKNNSNDTPNPGISNKD